MGCYPAALVAANSSGITRPRATRPLTTQYNTFVENGIHVDKRVRELRPCVSDCVQPGRSSSLCADCSANASKESAFRLSTIQHQIRLQESLFALSLAAWLPSGRGLGSRAGALAPARSRLISTIRTGDRDILSARRRSRYASCSV